jgi:aminopeptidase
MSKIVQMVDAAREAMLHVLNTKPEEQVLVVTDNGCRTIGNAFADAAREIGASIETYYLPEFQRPLEKPLPEMFDLLKETDVVINAFVAMNDEIPFRIKWIKETIGDRNRRLGHAPGITEEMMTEGPMNVNYEEMVGRAMTLLEMLKEAQTVHIITLAGTDITIDVEGRDFVTDVQIAPGKMGNLPAGEIFCAPAEDGANGLIVCDGVVGNVGPVTTPVVMHVQQGRLDKVESEDIDLAEKIKKFSAADDMAGVIGELGIGINPKARLTGNLLEDEKAYRTIHIAFGNNEEMPGGRNTSKVHRDYLFHAPTMTVTYIDGSQRMLIQGGVIQI